MWRGVGSCGGPDAITGPHYTAATFYAHIVKTSLKLKYGINLLCLKIKVKLWSKLRLDAYVRSAIYYKITSSKIFVI